MENYCPDYLAKRAEEIRSYRNTIDEKVSKMDVAETQKYLLDMAKNLAPVKLMSRSRLELEDHIIEKYASTFEDTREGYFNAFVETNIFPGKRRLPLDYVVPKFDLELISHRYDCSREHIEILLKKYSPKEIIEAYIQRKKKNEVILSFHSLGYSLLDFKQMKVKIPKEIKEILE